MKNEALLSKISSDIDHCEELLRNARGDDFAEKVRGWIQEKYEKMRDIKRTNEDLVEKIGSARERLRD